MKEAGQSPWSPPRLLIGRKPRSNPVQGGDMRRASGAEVSSTECLSPRLNLRRSTQVGAWNVMSLSEVRDKGVAVAVADRMVPIITEVTPVNERIMRLRITHILGVIPLVSVYAPTGLNEFSVKERVLRPATGSGRLCPEGNILTVLGDFNATTGTDSDGYESCVGPHGSGSRDESSPMLLDFGKIRRLRLAGSWFQRPDLHRWTW